MSDTTLNAFVAQFADAAARVAFTPVPPTPAAGPDAGYFAFQQDTGAVYAWNSNTSAWVLLAAGGGNVTAAGTLTANQLVIGGGTKAVAALGSLGTTTTVLHGNAAGAPTFGAVSLTADVTGVLPVANGGTGSASGAAILTASIALTNAQILALPTTPVTVVASPGAGLRLKLIGATVSINNTAADYTNINATYCELTLRSSANQALVLPLLNDSGVSVTQVTDFLAGSNGRKYHDFPIPYMDGADGTGGSAGGFVYVLGPSGSFGSADVEDESIQILADNNGSGNFTGGNAANVGKVTVYYAIESLAP